MAGDEKENCVLKPAIKNDLKGWEIGKAWIH